MGRRQAEMEPRTTTIESAEMYITKRGDLELSWRICYEDGRKEWRATTRRNATGIADQRAEKAEGKRRNHTQAWRDAERSLRITAKRAAERLFERDRERAEREEQDERRRTWSAKKDKVSEYIDEVCLPALEADKEIRESTRYRYRYFLKLVREAAGNMTIAQWLSKRYLKKELFQRQIAPAHGVATAKSAYSVTCKYVLGEMSDDDLVTMATWPFPPKWRPTFDQETESRAKTRRAKAGAKGVLVVTPEERARVMSWLVAQGGCERPSGNGMSAEQATYRRRELVDMMMLQATCGLRIHEVLTLTRGQVKRDADGYAVAEITDAKSKTHRGREVSAALDATWGEEVSRRLLERCRDLDERGLGDDAFVFGSCKKPGRQWSQENATTGALRRFYDEVAEACDVPVLKETLTHVWRASLATEYADLYARGLCLLDPTARANLFGHSIRVENDYYTKSLPPEQQRVRTARPGDVIEFRRITGGEDASGHRTAGA